jgi:hypothetical protein
VVPADVVECGRNGEIDPGWTDSPGTKANWTIPRRQQSAWVSGDITHDEDRDVARPVRAGNQLPSLSRKRRR